MGKNVYQSLPLFETSFNLNFLNSGCYFLNFSKREKVFRAKVIKN